MKPSFVRILFVIAAIYDGILGAAFIFAPHAVLSAFGVTPPNHWGYLQFPGALLITFALLYVAVAREPVGNRNLIPFGAMLKVSYCAVVFGYWFTSGIPDMWKPFALADLVFLVLFLVAYGSLGSEVRKPA